MRVFDTLIPHIYIDVFLGEPFPYQCGVLDTLYLILRRSIYDIVRFRCGEEFKDGNLSLTHLLLNLLERVFGIASFLPLSKRIVRLLGIVSLSGMTSSEFKNYIKHLTQPSSLTNAMLQSLNAMLFQQDSIEKACPSAFFCLGGFNAGLRAVSNPLDFNKDFQLMLWFRVENFGPDYGGDISFSQKLISCGNSRQEGFNILLHKQSLCLSVSDSSSAEPFEFAFSEHTVRRGVWYHLIVSHLKPKFVLFNSDTLSVTLDNKKIFDENVRLPRGGKSAESSAFVVGHNFDGNIGTIYVFSECLPAPTLEVLARISAGKVCGSFDEHTAADLSSSDKLKDTRLSLLSSKVLAVYHPRRVREGQAIDVHGGCNARMMQPTYAWATLVTKSVVESLGGISFLLPLFPKLLIDRPLLDAFLLQDSVPSGEQVAETLNLGTSFSDIYSDENVGAVFSTDMIGLLASDQSRVADEGCVGLLLAIITRFFRGNKDAQADMKAAGVIEMIEYVLTRVPSSLMRRETEHCAVSLVLMQQVTDYPPLQSLVIQHLFCNFGIWKKCGVHLQRRLISVVGEAILKDPAKYLSSLGVGRLLQQVDLFAPQPPSGKLKNLPL